MKLTDFLEHLFLEQTEGTVRNCSLKITNTSASINDDAYKTSLSSKEFRNFLSKELLGQDNINRLSDSLVELEFINTNSIEFTVNFAVKLEGSDLNSEITVLNMNKKDIFRKKEMADIKKAFKDDSSRGAWVTSRLVKLLNILFFLGEYQIVKEEPKTEEPTEEPPPETEEPKTEEPKTEEPKSDEQQ